MDFNALTDTRWGPMLYHRNDFYLGRSLELYGEFAPDEADMLAQLASPGFFALDGGANQGVFTILLGQCVGVNGAVYAIEPQRLTFQVLCGNVALNNLSNVYAIEAALGSEPGETKVPVLDLREPVHCGGVTVDPAAPGETVRVITIDGMGLTRLDLLKLDIEGHERAAIHGARRTIAEHQPVIYVENDKPEHHLGLISDIQAFGYRMFWHWPPIYSTNNWRREQRNVFGGTVSTNMLCLPPGDNREFGLSPVTDAMPEQILNMYRDQ